MRAVPFGERSVLIHMCSTYQIMHKTAKCTSRNLYIRHRNLNEMATSGNVQ